MKKILFVVTVCLAGLTLYSCKVKTKNLFNVGVYEARRDGAVMYLYTFNDDGKSGTLNTSNGISGLAFDYEVVEFKGKNAKVIFHMGDVSDNTEALITVKENGYTITYDEDVVEELILLDSDVTKLESMYRLYK